MTLIQGLATLSKTSLSYQRCAGFLQDAVNTGLIYSADINGYMFKNVSKDIYNNSYTYGQSSYYFIIRLRIHSQRIL